MSTILIPKGKTLLLNVGSDPIPSNGVELVLEEEITISLSSTFAPLASLPATNFITVAGELLRDLTGGKINFSGQWKQLGFQIWQGTAPVAFNCTVGFYMGTSGYNDAYQEVYKPTIELCNLALPTAGKFGNLEAPGPSVGQALGFNIGKAISIEIGNILRIPNVVIVKAEPVFSIETDENDWPIHARVALDITSIFSATTQLIGSKLIPKTSPPAKNSPTLGG